MQYKNLVLIGTSHIARQSLEEIESTILSLKPGIIAVELDRQRLEGLLCKKKANLFATLHQVGVKGFLFSIVGAWIQKRLGRYVGVEPGADMLKAVKLAKKNKMKLVLIDQDIRITLRRFSSAFTWKERLRFLADIFNAIFFSKREIQKQGLENFDLTKVPSKQLVRVLIKKLKDRYPNVYRVLILERNQAMARNLSQIMQQNPETRIVAVVGAGHEEELIELIKNELSQGINYSFKVD